MINSIRSQPAPLSLAGKKTYRGSDVLKALFTDFKQKCYLTEYVYHDVELIEVDHFATQNEAPHRKYEWDNLYLIHQKANQLRPKKTPDGGYLDPCGEQDNVEKDIVYGYSFNGTPTFRPRDLTNLKAVNTATLLTRIHQYFKQAIDLKRQETINTLQRWRIAKEQGNTDGEREHELLLRSLLSRNGLFCMLMRAVDNVPTKFFD